MIRRRRPVNFSPSAYYEQMVLADRSFGKIRSAMKAAGIWDRTIVLVTSDHGWRFADAHGTRRDHRVPFMLKLPGKSQGLAYEGSFRAWEANGLILAALSGELVDARAVASWLDERWPAGSTVVTVDAKGEMLPLGRAHQRPPDV